MQIHSAAKKFSLNWIRKRSLKFPEILNFFCFWNFSGFELQFFQSSNRLRAKTEVMEEISSQNSDLGLEDLDKLEAKGQAENTKRATSWGINCVTPVELNELLWKFYAEVKSENRPTANTKYSAQWLLGTKSLCLEIQLILSSKVSLWFAEGIIVQQRNSRALTKGILRRTKCEGRKCYVNKNEHSYPF